MQSQQEVTQTTTTEKNYSLKNEIKTLFKLALPLTLGQFAGTSMSVVDTIMSGRAGAMHMASVAIASSIWMPVLLFCQSLLMMITPFVAQKFAASHSENKYEECAHFMRQGIYLALAIGVFMTATTLAFAYIIPHLNFDSQLKELSSNYLKVMSIGAIPFMLFIAQRYYLEGLGLTVPTMFVGFLGLFINIPLNYIFIFGNFGMPALGAVGCAVASVAVCFAMAISMHIFVRRKYKHAFKFEAPHFGTLKRILFVSFPSAVATLMEVSLFAIIAILIAPFGHELVAGHQVASNTGSMAFMLPLSLAISVSIRTGNAYGMQDLALLKSVRKSAYILASLIGLFNALILILFRGDITMLYTSEAVVRDLAMSFLIYAAAFQFVDSIQITSIGLLRGYNDTKAIFILSFLAYWVTAFPIGYLLAFHGLFITEPMGAYGFWIGLLVGLAIGSILFTLRVFFLEKLPPEKLYKKLEANS